MCLNCGCGMPEDDMGHPDNITLETLAKAAIASNMSAQSTIRETKKTLENITPEQLEAKIKEVKENPHDHNHDHPH